MIFLTWNKLKFYCLICKFMVAGSACNSDKAVKDISDRGKFSRWIWNAIMNHCSTQMNFVNPLWNYVNGRWLEVLKDVYFIHKIWNDSSFEEYIASPMLNNDDNLSPLCQIINIDLVSFSVEHGTLWNFWRDQNWWMMIESFTSYMQFK